MSAPSISSGAVRIRRAPGGIMRRFVAAPVSQLGTHEFRGVIATSDLQPDGVALIISGGDFTRFEGGRGPFLDDYNRSKILGVIEKLDPTATKLFADGRFTDASELAQQRRKELKDGAANYFSISFTVDAGVPIPGGERATRWTLLEVSLTNLPVDPQCHVTARSRRRMRAASTPGVTPMQAALPHLDQALDDHRAFGRNHAEIADATQRLDEHRSRFGTALRGFHAAIQAGDPEAAAEHHGRCLRCLTGMNREMKVIGDRHQDAGDALLGVSRSLHSAGNVIGADLEGSATDYDSDDGEPGDGGIEDYPPHGRSAANYRQRQIERRQLEAAAGPRLSECEQLRRIDEAYGG